MATNRELEEQVQRLQASLDSALQVMERAGLVQRPRSDDPRDRPDFIPFGPESPGHAALLGLILLEDGQETPMGQTIVLRGNTGQLYCLEDELGAMRFYPGLALNEVVPVVLRQRINVYEAGPPPVPANAPSMWTPEPLTV